MMSVATRSLHVVRIVIITMVITMGTTSLVIVIEVEVEVVRIVAKTFCKSMNYYVNL